MWLALRRKLVEVKVVSQQLRLSVQEGGPQRDCVHPAGKSVLDVYLYICALPASQQSHRNGVKGFKGFNI